MMPEPEAPVPVPTPAVVVPVEEPQSVPVVVEAEAPPVVVPEPVTEVPPPVMVSEPTPVTEPTPPERGLSTRPWFCNFSFCVSDQEVHHKASEYQQKSCRSNLAKRHPFSDSPKKQRNDSRSKDPVRRGVDQARGRADGQAKEWKNEEKAGLEPSVRSAVFPDSSDPEKRWHDAPCRHESAKTRQYVDGSLVMNELIANHFHSSAAMGMAISRTENTGSTCPDTGWNRPSALVLRKRR